MGIKPNTVVVQKKPEEQQPPNPKRLSKDFTIKFNDKDGGGYYKVKVKRNTDGKLKFNYGFYDKELIPKIILNSEQLTDEGKKKYFELEKLLNVLKGGNDEGTDK